jgi:hypothetical protein
MNYLIIKLRFQNERIYRYISLYATSLYAICCNAVIAINIVIRMRDHMTCCDKRAHIRFGAVSRLGLSVVVDFVTSQVTHFLLNFMQPIT